MRFKANSPMTREEWIAAGKKLLEGVFSNIPSIDTPLCLPRTDHTITYPHLNGSKNEPRSELMEGIVRTFCLAAPLLAEDPSLVVNQLSVREYYRHWILRLCSKKGAAPDTERAGRYDENGYGILHQTVECGLLVIGLRLSEAVLWNTYSAEEKQIIADFISGYAHGNTYAHNWRIFNMLCLAFLHSHGYAISTERMHYFAEGVQLDYVGDGWYRDGQAFDYYTAWAYQIFLPIWNLWYGYEMEPQLAEQFEKQSCELMKTYPQMFDENGHMILWGRSSIYRAAAAAPFIGNLLLKNPSVSPVTARVIASGVLRQFLIPDCSNPDSAEHEKPNTLLTKNGILSLGFYGEFLPMVQSYSCAASPYWMCMIFWCLHFPADHPFWEEGACATEENSAIEYLSIAVLENTPTGTAAPAIRADGFPTAVVLNGPGLCISRHGHPAAVILRTGKVCVPPDHAEARNSYAKLAYHSQYPWAASPSSTGQANIVPMQYSLHFPETKKPHDPVQRLLYDIHIVRHGKKPSLLHVNTIFWNGLMEDVLYRRAFFDFNRGSNWESQYSILLADLAMPDGLLRVDRLQCPNASYDLTLASYSFPDENPQITQLESETGKAILLQSANETGALRQMAMTVYGTWDTFDVLRTDGISPAAERSTVIYAVRRIRKWEHAGDLLISQVLTREEGVPFTEEELFPIERIEERITPTLSLRDGRLIQIRHDLINRRLEL